MDIESNISELISIKSEIIALKNSNTIDTTTLKNLQDRYEVLYNSYQNYKNHLELLMAKLFPLQNYIFYALSDTTIHNETFIKDMVANYSYFIQRNSTTIYVTDLNPNYIRPISRIPSKTFNFLNNVPFMINISDYFLSITGSSLSYVMSFRNSNPRNSLTLEGYTDENYNTIFKAANIYGKNITLIPDYRGTSYIIDILAYDYYSSKFPISLYISEVGFPVIKTNISTYSVWLGTYNENSVTLYFDKKNNIDITYSKEISKPIFFSESPYLEGNNYYYISSSNFSYHFDIESIIITGNFIDNCNIELIDNITIHPYPNTYPQISDEYPEHNVLLIKVFQAPLFFYKTYSTPELYNIEYIIDLVQFNDEYFFIDDNTNITILDNNFLINNIVSYTSNQVIIYPDFRNIEYDVTIELTNTKYISHSNVLYINVIESYPPAPIRTNKYLFLNDILFDTKIQSFNLTKYFLNTIDGTIEYNYKITKLLKFTSKTLSNNNSNDYFIEEFTDISDDSLVKIIDSNLYITPDLRFISYKLYIYASNITYNVYDPSEFLFCTIIENKPILLSQNNRIPNIYEFTDNSNYYYLPMYFYSPIGNILDYFVEFSTDKRIEYKTPAQILPDNQLLIIGDFRNTTYDITITSIDPLYPSHPIVYKISVEELYAPYPVPILKDYDLSSPLNITPFYLNLNNLFQFTDWLIRYYIIEDIEHVIIEDSNLVIYPNLRGNSYNFKIYSKNIEYDSFNIDDFISISYYENYPILQRSYDRLITTNTIIDLNSILYSPIDNIIEYSVELIKDNEIYIPRDSYISSCNAIELKDNLLFIYMDYRDISYNLVINAIDLDYSNQSLKIMFDIVEPTPKKVTASSYSIIFNKESFIINDISTIDISTNWNKDELIYYTSYIFGISNRAFVSQSIYIENSNLLITNLIDLKFNVVPIEINLISNNKIISDDNLKISFIDIPTIKTDILTQYEFSYIFSYSFDSCNIIDNPFNNVKLDKNNIYIKPNFRGNIGKAYVTNLPRNRILYSSIETYNIKIQYDENIFLYFEVKEYPPFFISPAFYDNNNITLEFHNNNPYFINPFNTYFDTKHTDLKLVFEEISINNLRISNYPIHQNRYQSAYIIDYTTGQITIYPDFRNTQYTIIVNIFLSNFPEKYETLKIDVIESNILPINIDENIVEFKNLLIEPQTIYLRRFFNTYIYNQYLKFEVEVLNDNYGNFNLNRNILFIQPNAQGISYDLRVIATDEKFNNINSNLIIHIEEDRFIDYTGLPFDKFYINDLINEELLNIPYKFNISSYFKTYNNEPIEGKVTDCYLLDANFIPINPKIRPRDGIFNNRKQFEQGSFDYIATIEDNIMTFYVDSRLNTYMLEVTFWMKGYSNEDWNLTGNTFIVTESSKPTYIRDFFEDLNDVPKQFNLLSIYPTKSQFDSYVIIHNPLNNIEIINNTLTVIPDCRGDVTIESTIEKDNILYFGRLYRYEFIIAYKEELHIFSVTEEPPFYISNDYIEEGFGKTFSDIDSYTFNPITNFLRKNATSSSFVFETNIDNLKISGITLSKYPRNGVYKEVFTVNPINGAVTVFPDYRNISYQIIIKVYISKYPNKFILFKYNITEGPIPPIMIKSDSFIIEYNNLTTDIISVNIREQYDYIFKDYLTFLLTSDVQLNNLYDFDGNILYIKPFSRGISYNIYVTALDALFSNKNSDLLISISETRYLEYNENNYPDRILLTPNLAKDTKFTVDISSYFIKYDPILPLKGYITNAYIINNEKERPRDGIDNERYSNIDFEYIGTIDNNMITIYPDYRGETYLLRTAIWLDNYDDPSWILNNATFIVKEDSKTIVIDDYFTSLNLLSKEFDLSTVYNVPYDIDIDQYDIILNPLNNLEQYSNVLIIHPSCRGLISSNVINYIDNQVYYGEIYEYYIEIRFYTNYSFKFKVTENPPFFINRSFYEIILSRELNDLTPLVITPITHYFKSFTDLPMIIEHFIEEELKPASYPINEISDAYIIDSDGTITLYPFYRDISYSIRLKIYLETFPDKHIYSEYEIREGKIPIIVAKQNIITYNDLFLTPITIELSNLYEDYIFSEYLDYNIKEISYCNLDDMYYLENTTLYITPNAREFSYQLNVIVKDIEFNNINDRLNIYITEIGSILFGDIEPNRPINLIELQIEQYEVDISRYFIKNEPDLKIQGNIINAYKVDADMNPIYPLERPRDAIFNPFNVNIYDGTYNYLGKVKDEKLIIYPDYRGILYAVELELFVYNNDYNTKILTVIIREASQDTIEAISFENVYELLEESIESVIEPVFTDFI